MYAFKRAMLVLFKVIFILTSLAGGVFCVYMNSEYREIADSPALSVVINGRMVERERALYAYGLVRNVSGGVALGALAITVVLFVIGSKKKKKYKAMKNNSAYAAA